LVYLFRLERKASRFESEVSYQDLVQCGFESLGGHQMNMKLYEATIREPGPGTEERKVRIGAESAEEARRLLQQLYGPRSVPYLPRLVPG